MTIKVLLDTDIDILGDIDDAMCLAYLLAQPSCELLGITTVSWDTLQRARVASALCQAAGRRVPIYPGASTPLLAPLPVFAPQQLEVTEEAVLERWPHETQFTQGQAIEFLRQTIRDNPGDVMLLAIGPLTNIALLFGVDPEIPSLLKGLVLMGGAFTHHTPGAGLCEWNAQLDPHATAMVYRAGIATHRSIGLDVTQGMTLDAGEVRRRLGHAAPQPLSDMIEAWFRKSGSVTFHDPLAAASVFDEQICRFERGTVEVELASERLRGLTYWTPGGANPAHEVALHVDRERFFAHYFGIVTGAHSQEQRA